MQRWRRTTISVIGAILVAFTLVAFFLLDIERIALYLWALTFLLVAEIVLFGGLIAAKSLGAGHNQVFVKSGVTVSLSLYFLATLISLLFVRRFEDKLHTFIVLELGIIVSFAIIILLMLAFSRKTADHNRKIIENRRFIETCEKRVYNLRSKNRSNRYEEALNTLYEGLKYSDKIASSSIDDKIAAQITLLENALNSDEIPKDDVQKIFGEISALISQRKGEVRELKRGGF